MGCGVVAPISIQIAGHRAGIGERSGARLRKRFSNFVKAGAVPERGAKPGKVWFLFRSVNVSIPKIPSGRIRRDSEHCDMIWIHDRDHESAVVDRWIAFQVV